MNANAIKSSIFYFLNFRSDPVMKTVHRAAAALLICSFVHNAISFPAASLVEQEMEGDETRQVLGSRYVKNKIYGRINMFFYIFFLSFQRGHFSIRDNGSWKWISSFC